jgi:hypothetical protein
LSGSTGASRLLPTFAGQHRIRSPRAHVEELARPGSISLIHAACASI